MSLQRLDARACLDALIRTHGTWGIGLEREVLVDHLTKDLQASIREKHRKDSASNSPGSGNESEDPTSALQCTAEASEKILADSLHKIKDAWLDKTGFNGTVHSPAIILSMMLLAKSSSKPPTMTTNDWLKSHGIFGLTPTILRLTDKPDTSSTKLNAAAHRVPTSWKATALPPFMPKEYVDLCIDAATEQALEKLREVQQISNILANMERERLADQESQRRYDLLGDDHKTSDAAEDEWTLSDDEEVEVNQDLEFELMASEMFETTS
ncbi:hypothetical protein TI39_contig4102g00004 [Zymoseptoria brevis]|uniref:Uncharacterized protein n=1 Tax=Zymoseptoria brevis TaxID=1047168 RepID=A0A0F4GDU9_9PEZI|nr:hypothetical protein TI39_contig4102g00004 [Zymoseptoria brevis]